MQLGRLNWIVRNDCRHWAVAPGVVSELVQLVFFIEEPIP